jgi:hypothetical protein
MFRLRYLAAIRLTRLAQVPRVSSASNAPPDATMVRPYLRMTLDLFDSSDRGTAIRLRSSSDSCSRSISRSVSKSSSTPRNANEIYQSQTTRRNMREKKSIHSSIDGIALVASRGGGVGRGFVRRRGSSMKSPVSSNSGRSVLAAIPSESMSRSRSISGWSGSRFSASFASSVSPAFGGCIRPVIANGYFLRFR